MTIGPLDYPFGDGGPLPGTLMTVAPGVDWHRLPVPGLLKHVNCWLLDDGGGAAIVDTGYDDTASRAHWSAALAGRRVTRLICTHYHPDHTGLAGWMCRSHGAPLTMTRVEWLELHRFVADLLEPAESVSDHWRAAGWSDADIASSQQGWSGLGALVGPPPPSFRRIADGDRLTIGANEWHVVVGSGHSPEHACLLEETAGVLIAGDQVLSSITPNVSVTPSEPMGDPLGDWLASIAKLRRLDADPLVLPGHGAPFRGLHARLDAMAAGHRRRFDRLHALLAEPRRAIDCLSVLFRRPIGPAMLGMATGEALAHLRRLEVEGRAVRETRAGTWWFSAV